MNNPRLVKRRERKTVLAAISEVGDTDKFRALEDALTLSKFMDELDNCRKISGISKEEFRIAIKTELDIFEPGAASVPDPQIVEHLVDLLFEKGYREIYISDSISSSDSWLENRDVIILADLVGYRFSTDKGNEYDFINLSEEISEFNSESGSILDGMSISNLWMNADFRILITKNKTDEENRYALGLQNLLDVLPQRDKEYHYHHRLKSWDLCTELIKHFPVNFSIIDAVISNHGIAGTRMNKPAATNTIIASSDLLLADWIGALKMGIDPYSSGLNEKCLKTYDLPVNYRVVGDLSPYNEWKNVPLLLSDSVKKRNEIPYLNRMLKPWLQTVDKEMFPFKNVIDEQINSFVIKLFSDIDDHPLSYWVMILANYFFTGVYNNIESYKILFSKDNIQRKIVPLDFNIEDYKPADYEAVVNYINQLANIVKFIPKDQNGLRWRYIDKSVLFEYSKILPIPYDEFVSRVNICYAVQMMYDNIGGAYLPVTYDKSGRVKCQVERNIYLPQPNWMVIFGGQTIDVGKIETIKYRKNSQNIFWRTVNSSNKSADFDDGVVTFARHRGGTEITIVARQKFSLPVIWQVFDLDYVPQIKDALLSDAYNTFFSRTLNNYEAAFEGRNTGTGKIPDEEFKGGFSNAEQLTKLYTLITGMFEQLIGKTRIFTDNSEKETDELGYRHFKGTPELKRNKFNDEAKDFFRDLFEAFNKDLKLINKQSEQTP